MWRGLGCVAGALLGVGCGTPPAVSWRAAADTVADAEITVETVGETTAETVETVGETTVETVGETTVETVEETTAETVGETTYATLTFSIDDRANKTFDAGDKLAWKGSFGYAADTNVLEFDASWSGPFPLLYDDGPAPAGHERNGETAGDGLWTVTVQVPTLVEHYFEYGAAYGDGGTIWIWRGANGSVVVPAGSEGQFDAIGWVIPRHGTIDLRLEIDVSDAGARLDALYQGIDFTGEVKVKGSAWEWAEIALNDDGSEGDTTADDGIYTFVRSNQLGKHDGLLEVGAQTEFMFVLGGVEYKDSSNQAVLGGISAYSDYAGAGAGACVLMAPACVSEVIGLHPNYYNTMVTVGPE